MVNSENSQDFSAQTLRTLDARLADLARHKASWVETSIAQRIALLAQVKECLRPQSEAWAKTAAKRKGIADDSPLIGEEWLSGPYTVMGYCNQMMATLGKVKGKEHLKSVPLRELPSGQIAARVLPHTVWDHLLLSGVKVDVWMQPGVTRDNLPDHTASTYDPASSNGKLGKVALVLGAGNIASIAPLDIFHKLFSENQVVILKLSPVNDYLIEFLEPALKPLIEKGVLTIVRGDARVGEYLCNHPLVDEIHITGSGASHDAVVWGEGDEGRANKKAGTPKNTRRVTSELGAVCPTIVIPGPWSDADIAFQAEQVATQKLHNSGFNCVACQVLVVPKDWDQKAAFLKSLEQVLTASEARALYYPRSRERIAEFVTNNPQAKSLPRGGADPVIVATLNGASKTYAESVEVFAPVLSVRELDGKDPAAFFAAAIQYVNTQLYGTLGANIVIHPKALGLIGRPRFEAMLAELRYGTIAINTWTGIGFLTPQAVWGGFPGHTLLDVQSGIGTVHNSMLFDRPQRTVVEAPFKPYPRNLLSLSFSLLPKPPWFITNRKGHLLGKLLLEFQYRPSALKIPRIFLNALLG